MMRLYRILLAAVILGMAAGDALVVQAQPPYRRHEINDPTYYSAADQFELRQLMMGYIDATIVSEHLTTAGIHCYNNFFLTWHRGYIDRLEAWLMTQTNGSKYVPLPKWDPGAGAIPNAFFNNLVLPGNAVFGGYPPLVSQNITGFGNFNFAPFSAPGLCSAYPPSTRTDVCSGLLFSATALDNFAYALENEHNPVHGDVGGVMGSFASPAAAIFFLWHAYIDDHFRYYECTCGGAPAKDLYMKDDAADVGDEPNLTAVDIWESPDIWLRQDQDPFNVVTGKYDHEDDIARCEDAEFKLSGPNYVYVRIRNRGCQHVNPGEANLRVYWSHYSAGSWVWPGDWTNTPPAVPVHGDEITVVPISVPGLDPGQQVVIELPWTVPDPASYALYPNHFCLVARLESVADPMAVAEGPDLYLNVQRNNNIAWRNIHIYDVDPFNIVGPGSHDFDAFVLALADQTSTATALQFDFADNPAVHCKVELGQEAFNTWTAGGGRGTGFTRLEGTQIQIDAPGARLENFQLQPGTIYIPKMLAYLQNSPNGGLPGVQYGDIVPVRVTQYESQAGAADQRIVGGFTHELRAKKLPATKGEPIITDVQITATTCPEATDGAIVLTVTGGDAGNYTYWWSNGAATKDQQNLGVGTYTVYVRDNASGVVDMRKIAVKSASTLRVDMDAVNSNCGGNNGAARVGASGGKRPYAYQWYQNGQAMQGSTGTAIKNVPEGDYSVIVTDAKGCSATGLIKVNDNMAMLEAFLTETDATGQNNADGSAEVTASGMMGPFTYLWSNRATTERITGLLPGVYSVTVTDATGCSIVREITVSYPHQRTQGVDRTNLAGSARISAVVPNPAIDQTDMYFDIKRDGVVRIAIYDEVGRLVDLLYDGPRTAGENTLRIDTRALASGRYSLHLMFENQTNITPLVIVR